MDDGRQHSSGGLDGGPIITFVPSQTGPISVVVDQVGGGATTLYWLNHARRWRRTGTLAEAVLASPSMFLASGLKQPVYWTNTAEGGVSKVGSNGGAP
ncbi:MAG TPA: hypothetical protein VK841_10545, partial [Polyangiaceae bacterium]|nr:hypothetical protein [Polyangiaceae bacterium]